MDDQHGQLAELMPTVEAVRTLLDGGMFDDIWDMERFGCYLDVVNQLMLAAVCSQGDVAKMWQHLSQDTRLSTLVAAVDRPGIGLAEHHRHGVVYLEELLPELDQWYDQGGPPRGVHPGWETLARIYRIARNELTLVTGSPSAGKSTFTSALMVNLVQRYDWSIGMFSPEQSPLSRLVITLLEQHTGWPFHDGPTPRMDRDAFHQTVHQLNRRIFPIWTSDHAPDVDWLLETALWLYQHHGINGFVLDPWNDVDHRDAGDREDLYLARCLTKFRMFARDHNVHVWIIAHPKRLEKDSNGKYPVPGPYDISGGAKWRDKSDNILALWRDIDGADARILEIHVQKIRFRENGEMGMGTRLRYDPATGRYSDVED